MTWVGLLACAGELNLAAQEAALRVRSPGNQTYRIDAGQGDDANPPGKPWRSFANLNKLQLAPGDTVEIAPGRYEGTLNPAGEGMAQKPITIRFKPGVHTIGIQGVLKLPMFVSNSCDSPAPKPIGIFVQNSKYIKFQGGGVEGPGKTMIVYDGRMVEIYNDHSEGISFTGLVFDLKRPTVSEFRVLEAGTNSALIQVAEGSNYAIENEKFLWKGDWHPGNFCQEAILEEGRCWRSGAPRGWTAQGQSEAKATDLGERKVRLEFENGQAKLTQGHQYCFRDTVRDSVGVHNARCKDIVIRDCDFYALTGMGFVSQFTENITYQRVNVAPPKGTIRTCPAWADIFQFSNCKGNLLVDSCLLSGMQDDSINCHGTYLRIVGKPADNQLLMRFMHGQTYGFSPYAPGDEIAVMNPDTLREYAGNPRCQVTAVEKKTDKDWLVTLVGPAPKFEPNDIVDNITWNPNITVMNNSVNMDPVRGFLFGTRGKIVVENNTLQCAMSGILVEGDGKGWMESSPIRDMLIQKNRFINCGISIGANVKSPSPDAPVHENIRIMNNTFENSSVISARAVKGFIVSGNKSDKGSVNVSADASCTDVRVAR